MTISIFLVELSKLLVYFRSGNIYCAKDMPDVSSLLALIKIIATSQHKRQRKKSLLRLLTPDNWKNQLGRKSARAALCKWATCRRQIFLLNRLQTLQKKRNNKKLSKLGLGYDNPLFGKLTNWLDFSVKSFLT